MTRCSLAPADVHVGSSAPWRVPAGRGPGGAPPAGMSTGCATLSKSPRLLSSMEVDALFARARSFVRSNYM